MKFVLAVLAVLTLSAAAADPTERLADPAREARARAIFKEVRCLVCQSESIDESDAPLARDLRQLVREQVVAGRSDAQIRGYLVSRYGEFVLLQPRLSPANLVLWAGPPLVLVLGAGLLIIRARRRTPLAPLTEEEEARIAKLAGGEPS
ncbi:MAG: cytochrome c-type biogenesis protein [Caulobacterales bacterium]